MKRSVQKRRKRRRDERGVALVMVLAALTVLTVFLTELQEETSSELSAAMAERDALKAEYNARSAVNLARMLIATEPTIRNAIKPLFMMLKKPPPQIAVWEFSDMVLGPFNDANGMAAFGGFAGLDPSTGKNLGITGGSFTLKIVDEDSKINLNTAASGIPSASDRLGAQLIGLIGSQQYNPMFDGRDADDQFTDRATICGAIADWTDSDENLYLCNLTANGPSSGGAEDNFYQTIGLDYRRKNAPFDSLDELHLVRGISDDFWATFVDPEPQNPSKRPVTVWGRDKLNVNTATAQTLLALVCGAAVEGTELCTDITQMQTFLMAVTLLKGFTMGAPLFTSPKQFTSTMEGTNKTFGPMLEGLGLKPVKFKSAAEVQKVISTESKMFSIYAEGLVSAKNTGRVTKVKVHAVVDFRAAEAVGEAVSQIMGAGQNKPVTAGEEGDSQGNNEGAAAATPEAIAAAMSTNPAGNVVYWRVE